jgi:DNA-binding NtrC family response regulator
LSCPLPVPQLPGVNRESPHPEGVYEECHVSEEIEVLVLDDEEIVVERLKDYLQKKDIAVETFTSSQEALERLVEKKFHVIVTDIKMAKPDGIEVLVTVKKSAAGSEVILITGYGSIETMRAAEAVGAYDYLCKPFKMEELHKKIVKAAAKARKQMK